MLDRQKDCVSCFWYTKRFSFYFSANALVMNDDCQTPLDVARVKGHSNVVRAIEVYLNLYCDDILMQYKIQSQQDFSFSVFKLLAHNIFLLLCRVIFVYSLVGCESFLDQVFLKCWHLNYSHEKCGSRGISLSLCLILVFLRFFISSSPPSLFNYSLSCPH